jgi:hypothetical protein
MYLKGGILMLDLNFSLNTSKDREEFIENYIIGKSFTQKELSTIADYILYGKDNDGTSVVDRKEVQIDTKYKSYQPKKPESLEELLENPTFNENSFINTNIYKKIKPKINREEDKNVPGIQELWKTIDYYQHLLDVKEGKIIDPSARKLTDKEAYKIKHFIISLRREQFPLRDMVKPVSFFQNTIKEQIPISNDINWDNGKDFSIAPLGLYSSNPKRFNNILEIEEKDYYYNKAAKYVLDFRNPEHIYQLIEFSEDLLIAAEDNAESLLDDIIETLNFYINLADFDPIKTEILKLKRLKFPVLEIQKVLKEKFNITHSTNYISTIYKQKICGGIADAAQLHYDMYMERENRSKWKKCNQCGKIKFLDSRIYMRKSRSSDGYNNKCKKCCKENRKN